jgi:hypothetical protein
VHGVKTTVWAWVGTAIALIVLVGGIAVLVGGCGEDEPKRSALAENLAQLCEQARADTEALGLPGDVGFKVMKPTARIGRRLAGDVKKLKGTTPAESEQVASLAKGLDTYWAEVAAGVKLYEAGYGEGYAITVERARATLASAEALATRMGAPECAVRPFPDR